MVAFEDFPTDQGPIWILGKKYDLSQHQLEARLDVLSRLWFTYRKGFSNIGKIYPLSNFVPHPLPIPLLSPTFLSVLGTFLYPSLFGFCTCNKCQLQFTGQYCKGFSNISIHLPPSSLSHVPSPPPPFLSVLDTFLSPFLFRFWY